MEEDIVKDFMEYLDCKLELYYLFNYGERSPDKYIFRDDWTFENWQKGEIGKRLYRKFDSHSKMVNIVPYTVHRSVVKNPVKIWYNYSIYRSVSNNHKLMISDDPLIAKHLEITQN